MFITMGVPCPVKIFYFLIRYAIFNLSNNLTTWPFVYTHDISAQIMFIRKSRFKIAFACS